MVKFWLRNSCLEHFEPILYLLCKNKNYRVMICNKNFINLGKWRKTFHAN